MATAMFVQRLDQDQRPPVIASRVEMFCSRPHRELAHNVVRSLIPPGAPNRRTTEQTTSFATRKRWRLPVNSSTCGKVAPEWLASDANLQSSVQVGPSDFTQSYNLSCPSAILSQVDSASAKESVTRYILTLVASNEGMEQHRYAKLQLPKFVWAKVCMTSGSATSAAVGLMHHVFLSAQHRCLRTV